ncbi:multiple monosaccharide ABC transporter permease [Amycolatopsis granulosa]|uniref:multiple monosaccharide ABC transporter permease n=1 Tax=Amycolatopsis granulosa TaxID=185684 RepID=UPI001ABBA87F|nr:multiple monosaccharide ABC transporter permease [Amycolatopsis granulosa]NIH85237.1 putative multiple sugar transport system permease protein [Amycolatopsis granulosa]
MSATLSKDEQSTPAPLVGLEERRRVNPLVAALSRNSMFVALAAVIVVFTLTTDGVIVRNQNVSNVIVQNGYILILAIGMVMVIVGGHIDLSVGSLAGFVGSVSAVLMVNHHVHWGLAVVLSLVIGAAAGAFQGFWIAYVGVPSFIVTLAGMLTFRGLTLMVIGPTNIGSFPAGFTKFGSGYLGNPHPGKGVDLLTVILTVLLVAAIVVTRVRGRMGKKSHGEPVGSPIPFALGLIALSAAVFALGWALASYRGTPMVLVILLVLAAVYTLIAKRTSLGRYIYAVGGNRRAAELSGINAKRIVFFLFVNMGLLAALAGLAFTARLNLASSAGGSGFELEAIAAAFVGGAAVQGGIGTISGAIIGGLTIGVINNGMSIMGLGAQWQQAVLGLVLLVVVAFDFWNKKRRGRQSV